MNSRTRTESDSPVPHHCVVNLLGATCTVVGICVGLVLCNPVLEASALPSAEELLQELKLSDSDRQSIREGKIVTWSTHIKQMQVLLDGANVNHALVKEGWCWWYRKYAPENSTLEDLEAGARAS